MKRRPTTSLLGSLTTIALLAACAGGGDANGDSVLATDTAARQDSAAAQAQASSQALLDPNAATREQLAAVPGMPAHAVDAIVAGRPYENMVAVDRALAAHVADTTARNGIYGHVFKPIDLNAASDEEILLIPGIGSRMLHEFKEYRPYTSIEQFRREIGKYVDDKEVARLERYVTVPAK